MRSIIHEVIKSLSIRKSLHSMYLYSTSREDSWQMSGLTCQMINPSESHHLLPRHLLLWCSNGGNVRMILVTLRQSLCHACCYGLFIVQLKWLDFRLPQISKTLLSKDRDKGNRNQAYNSARSDLNLDYRWTNLCPKGQSKSNCKAAPVRNI
jgi:hypothetical protein